jgi:excinuclease ABC subunit C
LDAFGIAFDGLSCAISVLVCRGGKMLGVQNFSLISVSEQKGEMLAQFMLQYYEKNTIPHEILIEQNWPELQDVQTLLQSQKNGAVEFVCPKIAHKAKLVEMANSNAQMHLQNSISREKQKQNQTWGAITRLAEKLNLNSLPRRMECFDISNLGGTNSVASMVVFTDGEPDKKSYRKFKIRTVEGSNDFLSMQEALTRRLEKIKNGELDFGAKPNLIVIDGGKGQLSAAYEILQKSGVDGIEMISLAKQFEEVYKPNQSAPIMLERNSAELKLLQRLRDEAHRFAITFHRQLRSKNSFQSSLDNIERLGENKKKLLFATFGSVEKIKAASVEQLQQVNGIGKVLAQNIYNALHKEENN